jgi:hypothetical protein
MPRSFLCPRAVLFDAACFAGARPTFQHNLFQASFILSFRMAVLPTRSSRPQLCVRGPNWPFRRSSPVRQ